MMKTPNSPSDPDLSNFAARVPIILGTPMISHIMKMIKEKEINTLGMPWVNAQMPIFWQFNELQS